MGAITPLRVPSAMDLDEWKTELPLISDWVGPTEGLQPAETPPPLSPGREQPSSLSVAGRLAILFGFSI